MAAIAIGGGAGKLAVDVTERAGHIDMGAGKREFRKGVVIEVCIRPGCRGVADGAIGGEPGLGVIGIRGALVILGVAGIAIGGSARELAVDMAERAGDADMGAGQGEWSFRMVKNSARPTHGGVAG